FLNSDGRSRALRELIDLGYMRGIFKKLDSSLLMGGPYTLPQQNGGPDCDGESMSKSRSMFLRHGPKDTC
ncbi:MAG: hypothetical protein WCA45_12530, partial [Thiobacillaceae bacterium]